MKAIDLLRYLQQAQNLYNDFDQLEALIPVDIPAIGGKAGVEITSIGRGIDWDHYKFFIWPKHSLLPKGDK